MKKRTIGTLVAMSAVATCLFALTGANAAEQSAVIETPAGFLTAEQTLAEFNEISSDTELTLPRGVAWPTIPPAELSDTEALFEEGFIESTANLYWVCAWEDVLVSATKSGDANGVAAGRGAIAAFAKNKWFTQGTYDSDGTWRETVLKPALAGDLSGVAEQLAGCDYYRSNQ